MDSTCCSTACIRDFVRTVMGQRSTCSVLNVTHQMQARFACYTLPNINSPTCISSLAKKPSKKPPYRPNNWHFSKQKSPHLQRRFIVSIIQLSKLSGNYNLRPVASLGVPIIQLSKLSGSTPLLLIHSTTDILIL